MQNVCPKGKTQEGKKVHEKTRKILGTKLYGKGSKETSKKVFVKFS